MLTDSHCHLASHRFDPGEIPELLAQAESAGVSRLVTLATCLEDIEANLQVAENDSVWTCLGIHPCDVTNAPDDAPDRIASLLEDPRVCAVGETGLDYFHPAQEGWSDEDYQKRQQHFLRSHFEIATAAGLNVVIHTRDRKGCRSLEDALTIYQDFAETTRAVFHCFISSIENAHRVFDLGGIVSFGGVYTFKNAKEARATAMACPAGRFMLETDAPYLAPEPHRGKRNEPSFTSDTARFLADVRGESIEQLAAHTNRTADSFFRF